MANVAFNIAKGRAVHYATLPDANDALILIPLEATGLVADGTMIDYDTVAAILAGASNEQTTIGRKTVSGSVTVTVDDTGDEATLTIPDQTYVAPTGNDVGAFILAYDPDTTGGTDSDLIPLSKHDATWSPDGNNAVITFPTVAYTAE